MSDTTKLGVFIGILLVLLFLAMVAALHSTQRQFRDFREGYAECREEGHPVDVCLVRGGSP